MLLGSAFAGLMANQLGVTPLLSGTSLLTAVAGLIAIPLLVRLSFSQIAVQSDVDVNGVSP